MSTNAVWNNIDEIALYLGLSRLDSESNEDFVNRIRKFSRWKYGTDYYTLVHSIPIQLGLETSLICRFVNTKGNKFKCTIDWEYFTLEELIPEGEYIRIYIFGEGNSINKILETVSKSTSFSIDYCDNLSSDFLSLTQKSCDFIIRNTNIRTNYVYLDTTSYMLDDKNIVPGSLSLKDKLIEVTNIPALVKNNTYYCDYEKGYVEFNKINFKPILASYQYFDTSFALEYTELNLIPASLYYKNGLTPTSLNHMQYTLNNIVAA